MTSKPRVSSRGSDAQSDGRRRRAGPAGRSLLVGKPVVIAELDPQVASKIVERIAERVACDHSAKRDDESGKDR